MPIFLRFPIALVLLIVCLSTPTWADFQAGDEAYDRGDYTTALREWRPLAEQGVVEAQYNIGVLYYHGQGVPQDFRQARHWWKKAAAQGLAKAQRNLGMLYANDQGVPKDYAQAHKWYNLAEANGNEDAVGRRDALAKQMTHAQIVEAEELAREWKPIKK